MENPDGSLSPGIQKGGMSALPNLESVAGLPPNMLADLAKGKSFVFRIKTTDLVSNNLTFDHDKPGHVSIQPSDKMSKLEFNYNIIQTRMKWELVNPK